MTVLVHMEGSEKIPDVSSTASETRKNSKPVMEKKRRARINASLAELKSLLLDVMKAEGTRQNKMEKADILEMTVRHLRQLQRQQFSALNATDPAVINKYRLGFNECASEVSKYLANVDGLNAEFRARLLNHLANVTMNVEQPEENKDLSPKSSTMNKITYSAPYPKITTNNLNVVLSNSGSALNMKGSPVQVSNSVATDGLQNYENNNNTQKLENMVCSEQSVTPKIIHGVHTFPTQMSSGEVAFIIPAANMVQYGAIPNYVIPVIQPQGAIQIATSSSNIIQAQQTMPIAYSGTTSTPQSMVSSMVPNTSFVTSINNTTNLPVSLVSSDNGTLVVQHRDRSPIFTSLPVTNNRTQVPHVQSVDLSLNNDNKLREGESPLRSRAIVPSIESRNPSRELDKSDPMWRPW